MTNAGDSHFFDATTVDGLEMLCAGDEDGSNQVAKTLKQVSGSEGDRRGEMGGRERNERRKRGKSSYTPLPCTHPHTLTHVPSSSHLHLHTCASLVRG